MSHTSSLTDHRLTALYDAPDFGGERTMRAKVLRELIDEVRALRAELEEAESLGRHGNERSARSDVPRDKDLQI